MIPFHVVIPARYASVRLPGKPLLMLAGKPIIQHVYERAMASRAVSVVIATDDERIQSVALKLGATVCMTSSRHASGTDRITEAVTQLGFSDDDIIVNLQGDEPKIPSILISQVATELAQTPEADMASLCEPFLEITHLHDPNHVKVVRDHKQFALYFSRAVIPYQRDDLNFAQQSLQVAQYYRRHIGIYAYRVKFLTSFVSWNTAPWEEIEKLEQLRALWNGARVYVPDAVERAQPDVNTHADYVALQREMETA